MRKKINPNRITVLFAIKILYGLVKNDEKNMKENQIWAGNQQSTVAKMNGITKIATH